MYFLQPYYQSPPRSSNNDRRPYSSPKASKVQRSPNPGRRPRWQSPSPPKSRNTPSPKKSHDKYSHFRNITEKRDNPHHDPPSRNQAYSPVKKPFSKHSSGSYGGGSSSADLGYRSTSPQKSGGPYFSSTDSSAKSRSKSSPKKSVKSPYQPDSPPKKRHSRRNSFPSEDSPTKYNNNHINVTNSNVKNTKRPKVNQTRPKWVGLELSQDRRASDVSTIGKFVE